ncbi:hypothetical protein JAAARDRAFT_203272 [Jaapia argillacea MUCL 33604]|uniref:F-box domain-containing protein n=1 Tax=Jaapia argillacea MUCL 33604 TaxID=933084 RepID=A0A067QHH1_9AGAM|nr:hypothetical protein JAAARDRAFT_203272 [Jaapia argillacea MUCL 33604]
MHNALQIPEILENILENLNRKLLSVVSRTCLVFRDPALDLLWKNHATLGDLIRCMPSDAWKEVLTSTPDTVTSVLTFARPLVSSDWPRFQLYASRIKCLEVRPSLYRSGRGFEIEAKVLLDLSIHRPCSILFPHLQELLWTTWAVTPKFQLDTFHFIDIFLGPNLRKLNISYGGASETEAKHFLSSLRRKAPKLLSLNISNFSKAPVSLNMSALARFTELQTLIVPITAPEDVVFISSLPRLHVLDLTLSLSVSREANFRRDLEVNRSRRTSTHPASVVRSLTVREVGLDTFAAIMRTWDHHALEAIFVSSLRPSKAAAFQEFVHALTTHCSPSSLTSIRLIDYGVVAVSRARMAEEFTITPMIFSPILSFTKIRHYEVSSPFSFAFDNAFVRQLAMAWPEITHLDLARDDGRSALSQVTLEGLTVFPLHCPSLALLGIVLHQASKVVSTPIICNDTPILLDFGQAPIQDPADVARFISGLYTYVTKFCHLSRFTDYTYAIHGDTRSRAGLLHGWTKVADLYSDFAKVRAEDQRRE